ncbi:MAG TPA: rhodanese-like domain-containing protein [Steroidobacteraceae bacterium]|jgi:rhodanese-related sulfurtransferase|nr:rhodanese-like domain-containing protein [Steroidobacteraceae bacterium]
MDQLLEYIRHNPWPVALAVITFLAVLVYEMRLRTQNTASVVPQDAIRMMNQGATVLDLRAQKAYDDGHINGARHFEAVQILEAGDSLKRYRERPLILYCDRGTVAAAAGRTLTRQGFTKVFTLRGGLDAWRAEKLPLARG